MFDHVAVAYFNWAPCTGKLVICQLIVSEARRSERYTARIFFPFKVNTRR